VQRVDDRSACGVHEQPYSLALAAASSRQ
jgi:hypothetical protein